MKTSSKAGAAGAGAIMLAVTFIQPWEGLWLTTKPDKLAHGICTGGFGETEDVKCGETHTKEYWEQRLAKRLPEYDAKIEPCIHVQLSDKIHAALISAAYNAGPGAVCSSPMLKKMNAGDIKGGCESIAGWRVGSHPRKDGPLVIQKGLINRRNAEKALCLEGLNSTFAPTPEAKTGFWTKLLNFLKGLHLWH